MSVDLVATELQRPGVATSSNSSWSKHPTGAVIAMGNHQSATLDGQAQRSRGLLRQTNALGLSKGELDQRCQPSGLYESCQWEPKAIRRLIGDGKIAARLKGNEGRQSESEHECPICFLNYREINVTKCCKANLCTECYLQVRPQKEKMSCCPFCNHSKLSVQVAKALDASAIHERESEEQRVIEAQIRSRSSPTQADAPRKCAATEPDGFGSSLAQHAALMRARSGSLAESDDVKSDDIATLAMTPDARRALEDEMRAQHFHPVAQRVEQEEAMRRIQNEQEHSRNNPYNPVPYRDYRSESGASSRSRRARGTRDPTNSLVTPTGRPRTARDWNRIVESFENGGHGAINSLDDLVVLEAAIMLSMEEEARRGGDSADTSDSETRVVQHASEGFPLTRARIQRRSESSDDEDDFSSLFRRQMQRSSSRHRLLRPTRETFPMETAMLMGGVSEEEQIAMAIAASLSEARSATGTEVTAGPNAAATGSTAEGADEEHVSQESADRDDTDRHASPTTEELTHGFDPSVQPPAQSRDNPSEEAGSTSATACHTSEESLNLAPSQPDAMEEGGSAEVDTIASRSFCHDSSSPEAFL